MVSKNYVNEVGMDTGDARVSRPVAYAIVAIVAVVFVSGLVVLLPAKSEHGKIASAAVASNRN